jgi:putative Mn2+ efflux pump MntP
MTAVYWGQWCVVWILPGLDTLMNLSATILLAFGMSMDAFAASIGKGASLHKPKFSEALRTGLIFGVIETLTPLIGWGLGMLASQFVLEWNHWIAFVLLVFLGGRMIIEGVRGDSGEEEAPTRHGFWLLVTTAIATSLDAMAVGVGLAFLQVNIIMTALAIGCATLIMSTLGMMVGRYIGPLLGKRAEILGGIVLIGIGSQILWSHFAG